MHHLKLLVRDSQLDARYLIISDISQYDDLLNVSNATLFIQLPGFASATQVMINVRGTQSYNSKTLGLSTGNTIYDLPDGLYAITYSVAPNAKVYVAHYHYRTAYLEKLVYAKIADLVTNVDQHSIDVSGNIELTKREAVLTRALLLLEGIKANMLSDKDVVKAEIQYKEVQTIIENLKTGY
jgi:ribosomal protein L27